METPQLKMNQIFQGIELGTSPRALLVYLLFFFSVFFVIKIKTSGVTRSKFPPSPSKLPFIGNLHQLHGAPHHAFWSLAQKHGSLMSLHLGSAPIVVVSSADTAREVLKTYDHVFVSRPQLVIPNRLVYGKDMAFGAYGEYWRQVRKICVLQLLSVKKVHSFRGVREEEVACMVEKIEEVCLSNAELNLSEMFMLFTNNIICRVAFGRKYDQGERGRKFRTILKEFSSLLGVLNIEDLMPSLAWVNNLNGINKRVEKNFKEIDSFLDEVIEEHIGKKIRRNNDVIVAVENEADFVDVMLEIEKDSTLGIPFGRDNTKAIILDMFTGGTDTASVVLEWAMSELLRNPAIMEEVQKEVRKVTRGRAILKESDTQEMHYLKSVIKETLRLHPSIPLFSRESIQNVNLQGYEIPSKTAVTINLYAIGRDPTWWEEPEKFRPERFLNGRNASVDLKGQDFHLIPFGAGRRGCPGLSFAMSVVELALANLLNRFDWVLPNEMDAKTLDMNESSGITACKQTELILTASPYNKVGHIRTSI